MGTPGTVKRWVTKGYLDPASINIFVLDEADKMVEEKALGKKECIFSLIILYVCRCLWLSAKCERSALLILLMLASIFFETHAIFSPSLYSFFFCRRGHHCHSQETSPFGANSVLFGHLQQANPRLCSHSRAARLPGDASQYRGVSIGCDFPGAHGREQVQRRQVAGNTYLCLFLPLLLLFHDAKS